MKLQAAMDVLVDALKLKQGQADEFKRSAGDGVNGTSRAWRERYVVVTQQIDEIQEAIRILQGGQK